MADQELQTVDAIPPTFGGLIPDFEEVPVEGTVSLEDDTEAPAEDLVSVIAPNEPRPGLTGRAAEQRAAKANFALGDSSPGVADILQSVSNGTEDLLRRRMTDLEIAKNTQARLDVIRERAAKGQTVAPEDIQFISGMASFDPSKVSPETILERKYANQIMNSLSFIGGGKIVSEAYQKDPQKLADQMSAREELLTRQEIVKSVKEDVEAIYNEQGWGPWAVDQAKSLFPLYSTLKIYPGPEKSDSWLAGNVIEDMANYYWSMPIDQMASTLRQDLMKIADDNPSLAKELATKVLSHTGSDQFIENFVTVLDAATFPGVVSGSKLAAKGAQKVTEAARVLRGTQGAPKALEAVTDVPGVTETLNAVVRANRYPDTDLQVVLNEMGDAERAANVSIVKRSGEIIDNQPFSGDYKDVKNRIMSIFSPEKILEGEKPNLAFGRAEAIVQRLRLTAKEIEQAALKDTVTVARTPEEAFLAGVRETAQKLQDDFREINDAILDVGWRTPEEDKVSNVGKVVIHLGGRDRLPFESSEEAIQTAIRDYRLLPEQFEIEQQGATFNIAIVKPVDETTQTVRQALKTKSNTHDVNFFTTLLGFFRTADDRVPEFIRENRKTATHARSTMESAFKSAIDRLGFMNKQTTDELNSVMRKNKYEIDPLWDGKGPMRRGYYYRTVQEFEESFFQTHQKFPTEQQVEAYFLMRQFNDYDYFFRNAGWYRDRARQGIEEIQLHDVVNGDSFKSERFMGKVVDDLPWTSVEDTRVLVHRSGQEPERMMTKQMTEEQRSSLKALQSEGYRIIKVENPTRVPYESRFGKETVNFIVTKDVDVLPLPHKQAPYREGWHTIYEHEWFVKQPKMEELGEGQTLRHRYVGDVTFTGLRTEVEAKKWASQMEEARKLLLEAEQNGNYNKLRDFLKTSDLPFNETKFRSFFEPKLLPDGSLGEPALAKNRPFLHVFTKNTTTDTYGDQLRASYQGFEDTVRSEHNMFYNLDKKFYGMRDDPLQTFDEIGTDSNPVWRLADAEELDPMTSVQQAVANVLRSRHFADYKIAHTEAWMSQFGHLLDVPTELRMSDPVFYIHQGTFVRPDSGNYAELRAAKDSRRALIELLGTKDELEIANDWIKTKLLSSVYEDAGQKGVEKISDWLSKRKDKSPIALMRQVAFHTNIGLYNPYQLLQNVATMANAIAISPKYGLLGSFAAMPMRYAFHNPKLIDQMAKFSRNYGWTEDLFKESMTELRKSGRFIIEGEHAWKDELADPSFTRNRFGQFIDHGLVFFKEGERLTRLTAWNAAFREFRAANPTTPLTDAIRRQILDRSDLMTANMTRASNATWQQGLLAIPAQFMSYHTRLAEQMLGKRLTTAEKLRVIGVNSMMFGVPIGLLGSSGGGALFGGQWNIHEGVRENLLKKGYAVNDNWTEVFHNGMTGLLSKVITGEPTNLNEKLGPGGGQLMKSFMEDKTFVSLALGASGSKTGSFWESLDPVTKWVLAPFRATDGDFPLRGEDILGIARNIKSVDNAVNIYYAHTLGKMISKNGETLGDITPTQAWFQALTGASPRSITDKQLMQGINLDRTKLVREVSNAAGNDFSRMLEAASRGDESVAQMYRNRIEARMVAGGLTVPERTKIFQEAIQNAGNKLDKIQFDFVFKNAPADQAKARQDNFLNQGYAGQK